MKWLRVTFCTLLACLCGGCSVLRLPWFDYCEHVRYERTGNAIELEAQCNLP